MKSAISFLRAGAAVARNAAARMITRSLLVAIVEVLTITVIRAPDADGQIQRGSNLLVSREALSAAAERAESIASTSTGSTSANSALLAASIRQRLREGDFRVGDRVVVAVLSDVMHRDTLVVRAGRVLEIPGKITVQLGGVLRSELHDRVATEVLKYVKAQQIEVVPLMRLGMLGEITHPGFFAFGSDIPVADAIMAAGGPTVNADIGRSFVRRGNREFRSPMETSKAIANGLTLDQFGLDAGDELIIGHRREINPTTVFGIVGALASVITVYLALHR